MMILFVYVLSNKHLVWQLKNMLKKQQVVAGTIQEKKVLLIVVIMFWLKKVNMKAGIK